MNILLKTLGMCLLLCLSAVTFAQDSDTTRIETIPTFISDYEISSFDNSSNDGISLSGIKPRRDIYFAIRHDEIIRKAQLNLEFTPSPSLIPIRSQLNVYLNNNLQQVIPIDKEELGRKTIKTLELDPLLIKDYNSLSFEFIGHYTDYCENIVNSTIWLNISSNSYITLNRQKLHVQNDLAFFPQPFIDTGTKESNTISIILPTNPESSTIKAAAIIASYGGTQAKWRGINYPVFFNRLPVNGHAIAFITNSNRPQVLLNYPKVTEPTIEIMDIPHSINNGKLLVISAPEADGLPIAAAALAQGSIMFNGPVSKILEFTNISKRKPYDAPNWIDIEHKSTFAELIEYNGQLNSSGLSPQPININLALPPDLYFAEGSRINLELFYHYNKPSSIGYSQMQMLFNNHLVRSYPLKADRESDSILENLPLIGFENMFNTSKIDSLLLRQNNQMTFDFQYNLVVSSKHDECTTQTLINNRVEIDPKSTLDFTGLYHFTKMPNLSFFWQSGYPFSIYADLQTTTAIVDDPSDSSQLTTLFNTLGRIAGQIGYTALNIDVISAKELNNKELIKNRDLLIIGRIPEMLKNDRNIHVILSETEQSIQDSFNDGRYNRFKDKNRIVSNNIKQKSSLGLSSIISFESPITSGKTVVALISDSPAGSANLNKHIILNQKNADVHGSVTVFRNDQTNSLDVGTTYYIGNLPWYQRLWYYLLQSPILLMVFSLTCAVIFCYMVYKFLMHIRSNRLIPQHKNKD